MMINILWTTITGTRVSISLCFRTETTENFQKRLILNLTYTHVYVFNLNQNKYYLLPEKI